MFGYVPERTYNLVRIGKVTALMSTDETFFTGANIVTYNPRQKYTRYKTHCGTSYFSEAILYCLNLSSCLNHTLVILERMATLVGNNGQNPKLHRL